MRKLLLLILIIGLAFGIFMLKQFPSAQLPLTAAGTIEARTIRIGSKIGGRISEIYFYEGDKIKKGELLLIFAAPELAASLEQARAQQAETAAQLARLEHGARSEEIAEARALSEQTRHAEVTQARAEVTRAQTAFDNAELNVKRAAALRSKNLLSPQNYDDLVARRNELQAALNAANASLTAAEGRLTSSRAVMQRTERGFRSEEIAAGRAALERTKALVREIEARYAEREVIAPADAIIEVFDRRPGDLIPAGSIIARLLEEQQLYVMVYVPETQIANVVIGQAVKVSIDGVPEQDYSGQVEQVRTEAEFLPRNVQTPEERVHQVIGVKVRIETVDSHLHAGMTALVKFVSQ